MEKAYSEITFKSFFNESFYDDNSDNAITKKIDEMMKCKTLSLHDIDCEIILTEQKLVYLTHKINNIQADLNNEIELYKAIHKYNKEKFNNVYRSEFDHFNSLQSTQKNKIHFFQKQIIHLNMLLKYLLTLYDDFRKEYPQADKSPISPREILRHSPRRSSPLRVSQTLNITVVRTDIKEDPDEEKQTTIDLHKATKRRIKRKIKNLNQS